MGRQDPVRKQLRLFRATTTSLSIIWQNTPEYDTVSMMLFMIRAKINEYLVRRVIPDYAIDEIRRMFEEFYASTGKPQYKI